MLTEIGVRNFKCFENQELELSNLNLFSGINSMGKSTMIQALLLLRQSEEQGSLDKGIYLNGKYVTIGSGWDLLYRDASDETIGIEISDECGKISRRYAYKKDADFLAAEGATDKENSSTENFNLFQDGFCYIAADRLGPQSVYQKSYYEVWENQQLGSHGEYAVHFLQLHGDDFVENQPVLYPGKPEKNLRAQVENWMGEITPGISLQTEDYGHSNRIGLAVRQGGNYGEFFSALNVGFGISYVLPMVLALVKAKAGDLLILENPEAHLHPAGQRKMGELMARAAQGGVQIIVETHSDHVLNGIRISAKRELIDPAKVRLNYFSRKSERINGGDTLTPLIENPVLYQDGRLSFWPDGFFDEWDKAIDTLF